MIAPIVQSPLHELLPPGYFAGPVQSRIGTEHYAKFVRFPFESAVEASRGKWRTRSLDVELELTSSRGLDAPDAAGQNEGWIIATLLRLSGVIQKAYQQPSRCRTYGDCSGP